jgi:type I restriction enzyme S subunit
MDCGVALGGDLNILRTKSDGYFLASYISGKARLRLASMAQGNSVVHLYGAQIASLEMCLPPLPEQQKIASFLSSVDKKIDLLRQKKDGLELYKKGLMQKIFLQEIRFKKNNGSEFPDWEEVAFGDVVEINSDKRKTPSKFRYIDLESVKGGVLTNPQEISSDDAPSRAQRVLMRGDILFQLVRPYQMNNLFFDYDGHFVASTGYAQLRSKNNLFVFYLIHLESFVTEVSKRSTGSNYPAINSNDLKTIQFYMPVPEEQQKIASFLSAADAKIQKTSSQIEQMEIFKKGLLQQMFV